MHDEALLIRSCDMRDGGRRLVLTRRKGAILLSLLIERDSLRESSNGGVELGEFGDGCRRGRWGRRVGDTEMVRRAAKKGVQICSRICLWGFAFLAFKQLAHQPSPP
jgi:hypothetical protein